MSRQSYLGSAMRGILSYVVLALLAASSPAYAAEQVTLRNGFTLSCNHHAPVDGRIRFYLSRGEDNYIDVTPAEIVAIEQVPDPPDPPAPTPAAQPTATPRTPQQLPKLTEADLREMLSRAGKEHNLDVDLLASVVKAESDGNVRAVSRAGAQGLMQLMPQTAAGLGVQDSFEPDQNVRGGSAYLDQLLTLYHDNLALALAAYNAGPDSVAKYHGIPPYRETHVYVARVIHEFNRRVVAREAQARHTAAPWASQPATSR